MNNFINQFEKYNFSKLGFIKIPRFEIPKEEIKNFKLKNNFNSSDYLAALIKYKFNEKLNNKIILESEKEKYYNRVEYEFNEIVRLHFTDYILLVYHLIDFCKKSNILNSPGRGSSGGSLLLYILDCVKINPIKYNLLFERFISSARTELKEIDGETYISSGSLPDFDLDSQRSLKYKINEYIDGQFPNKTVSICNISTFQTKVLLKEVLKAYEEMNEENAKEISKMVESQFGKIESFNETLKTNENFKDWAKKHEETVRIVKSLYQLNKNKSVHASGILICNENIKDCLPLELDSEKNIVCGYTMNDAQMFGTKLDNLGLKNLDAISNCLILINKKIEDIDVNDNSIYEFLNKTDDFYGIFQAEEGLGKSVMKTLKCKNVEDLGLSVSVGRPGSIKFLADIKNAKETNKLKDWGDNRINDTLKDSYSVIVYQENIMALCKIMADFSSSETNEIRKIIGKKLDTMPLWKDKFINQSINNGFDEKICEEVWQTFEDSGNYLFCKSHGFLYGHLTAICIYLKANYPKEFYFSLLKNAKYEQKPLEEVKTIISEIIKSNISILPPHILKSDYDFSIQENGIRMGIGNIKGISEKSIEKLQNFKTDNSTKFDLFYAANEAHIPINVMASLILAGSMDDLITETRSKIMLELILWNLLTLKEKKYATELGSKHQFKLIDIVKLLNKEIKNEKGKNIIKDSRMETIRKHYNPYIELHKYNNKNPDFCKFWMERELLGYSYSTNLLKIFKPHCSDLISILEATQTFERERVHIIGEIIDQKEWKSREKKLPCMKLKIQDHTSNCEILFVNSDTEDRIGEIIENNGRKPKEGDIVIIRASKGSDIFFGRSLSIQQNEVFMKISQLKDTELTKIPENIS